MFGWSSRSPWKRIKVGWVDRWEIQFSSATSSGVAWIRSWLLPLAWTLCWRLKMGYKLEIGPVFILDNCCLSENSHRREENKKVNVCVLKVACCLWYYYKIGLRWRGHCMLRIEKDMVSNVSGADCYKVFVMVAFSPKACQALAY